MVLPCLDGSPGCIMVMTMRRDALEVNAVFLKRLFEFVGAFVVEDVRLECKTVRLDW